MQFEFLLRRVCANQNLRTDSPRINVKRVPASRAVALLILLLTLASTNAFALFTAQTVVATTPQTPKTSDDKSIAVFSGERAFEHVRRLVEFGPRPAGSKQLERARDYIVSELKSYGLKVSVDEFTERTPKGRRKMANITAEIPGESSDFIILASHYDTKYFDKFRFVGANDGGSSTGALLEIARAFSASTRKPHFSYRFVFFDGEEAFCRDWDECGKPGAPDNTYGSRRYVANLRVHGELKRTRAMILLDMVGYKQLRLGRDSLSTVWLVDLIWQTAKELGHGEQFVDQPEDVGGDDHEHFINAGVDAVDIIQLNSYPHWHTREDTLDKISARSLQIVGEVVLASLPHLEEKLKKEANR